MKVEEIKMRNYEGTTRLQQIGICEGIQAKNLMVGDVLVWNFGSTSTVKKITFSASGKTLTLITEIDGKEYTRRINASTIVVVKELNPKKEEVKEEVKPKHKKASAFEKWLRTFVEEKGLDVNEEYVVSNKDAVHFISLERLIEIIIGSSDAEQKQIKDTIVRIDFKNGDITHFFKYLAEAYIKTNF